MDGSKTTSVNTRQVPTSLTVVKPAMRVFALQAPAKAYSASISQKDRPGLGTEVHQVRMAIDDSA